jgi:hypothetical protein
MFARMRHRIRCLDTLELDLGSVVPSLAAPKTAGPVPAHGKQEKAFKEAMPSLMKSGDAARTVAVQMNGDKFQLAHGAVVIAAITRLHQQHQSFGADRSRIVGQESGGEGSHEKALGKNQLGAGI